MSYNGSGTFNINTAGQPVVTGTVISSTAFNALTADLGTGLSTAITKDGQTVATARIPFAQGINSSLVTDATSTTTGSIITAGGVGIAKALYVGTTANIAGTTTLAGVTATSITDSGLTSGRVTYATTAGLLTDAANLTFNGTTLTANTIGAFTLGGTVAGGGNQLNNVIIGTTTPLAGNFTTGNFGTNKVRIDTLAADATYGVITFNNSVTSAGLMGFLGKVGTAFSANVPTGSIFNWNVNDVTVLSASSTGLAVTGTLDTTGAFTTTGGSNVQTSWTLQESGTRSLVLKNPTNVLAASVGTGTNHDLQVEGSQVYIQVGSFGSRSTAATFDSSGNLLVGNTATIGSSKILSNFSATTSVGIVCNETNNTANTKFIGFHNQSTDIGSITRVGSTSAVIYNTTSDYRLKTIVGAVTGQGERIDALKPIDYLWTEGGQQARGFLAHEFQEVYASSVTGTKDSVDEDGNPIYQGMQAGTAEVIADLVAELQSLRKRITALEAK